MNKFRTKKLDTQTLGEYLAQCREGLGLSCKEAGLRVNVQPKYIEALEEGSFEALPADVYVRGFLRSLASEYQISETRVLAQYRQEREISQNLSAEEEADKAKNKPRDLVPRFVLSPKTLTIAAVVLAAVVSLGYLYSQIRSLSAAPKLVVSSPAEDGTVNSALLEVSGETEPGAAVLINSQPVVVDAGGSFQESISLVPGSNQIEFLARNKFDEESVVKRVIVFQEKEVAGAATSTSEELGD